MKKLQTESSRMLAKMPAKKSVQRFAVGGPAMSQEMFQRYLDGNPGRSEEQMRLTLTNMGLNPPSAGSAPASATTTSPGTGAAPVPYNPIVPTPATSAPVPLPVAAPVAPQVIAPPVASAPVAPAPVAPAPVTLPVAAPAAPVNASSNMYAAENARRAAMAAEEAARKRALYAKTPVVSDKAARQKAESDAKNARKQAELKAKSARAPQFSAATNRSTYKAPPPLYSSLPRDPLPPPIRLRDPLPPPIRFTPATNRSTYKAPPPLYSPAPAASRSTAPLPTRAGPQFTPATNRNTFVPARPLYSPAPAARATPAAPVFRPASNQPAPQSRFDQMMANLPAPARPMVNVSTVTNNLSNVGVGSASSPGSGSADSGSFGGVGSGSASGPGAGDVGSGIPSSPGSGSADSGSFDGVPAGGSPSGGGAGEEVPAGGTPAGGGAGEGGEGGTPAGGTPAGGTPAGGTPGGGTPGGSGGYGSGGNIPTLTNDVGMGGGMPATHLYTTPPDINRYVSDLDRYIQDTLANAGADRGGVNGSPSLPGQVNGPSAQDDLSALDGAGNGPSPSSLGSGDGFPQQGDPGFPLPGDPGFPTLGGGNGFPSSGGGTSARDDLDGFDQVGTAPGQVNGPSMGTAPGQVNGPPMGTAPGQVNGPPMGTAPGQVNGPPMGTAPGQVNANIGSPVVPPVAPPTAAEQAAALRALIKAGPQTQEELDKALLKYSPQQLAAAFPEFGGVPEYTTAAEEARKRAAAAAAAATSPVVAPPPVAPPPVAPPPVAPPPVAPPPVAPPVVAPPPVAPPVVAPPVVAPPVVAPPPVAPPVVPPTGIPVTMPTGPGEFGPGTMLPRPGTGGTPSGPVVPGYGVPTVPGAGIRPPGLNAFEDEVLKRQAAGISTSAFDVNLPPPPNSYERPMVPDQAGSPFAPASPARSMGNGSLDPHTLGSYKKLSDTFGTTRDRMGNAVASAVLPTTDAVRRGQLSAQAAGGGASMSNTLGTTTDRFGNVIAAPTMPAFFKEGGEAVSSDTYISDYLQQEQEKTDSADIDPLGTAQKYLTDLTGATKKLSPVRQSIKRPSRVAGGAESSKEMNLKLSPLAETKKMVLDTTSSPGEPKNTDSARAQMEAFVEQYKRKIKIAQNKARGLRANTLGAPTLEAPTLTRNTLAKKTFAEGGEAKNFEDEEVSQEELDAASRPAFVTPKSGKGRKEGEISKQLKSGAAYANMAKGVTELPYDLAGAGVDLATMAMRPFGYSTEKPVLGSDFIKEKMTKLGVRPEPPVDPTAKGFYTAGELLSNLVNPAGAVRAGVKGAEKVGQAATNVGKDFMEYNRQISVPGASYAVAPKAGKPATPLFTPLPSAEAPFVGRLDKFVAELPGAVQKDQFLGMLKGKFRDHEIGRAQEALGDLEGGAKITPSDLLNRIKQDYDPARYRTQVIEPEDNAFYSTMDNPYQGRPMGVIHLIQDAEPLKQAKDAAATSKFDNLVSATYSTVGRSDQELVSQYNSMKEALEGAGVRNLSAVKRAFVPYARASRARTEFSDLEDTLIYPSMSNSYKSYFAEAQQMYGRDVPKEVDRQLQDRVITEAAQKMANKYGMQELAAQVPDFAKNRHLRNDFSPAYDGSAAENIDALMGAARANLRGTLRTTSEGLRQALTDTMPPRVREYRGQHSSLRNDPNPISFSRFTEHTADVPGMGATKGIYVHELQSDRLDDIRKSGPLGGSGKKDYETRLMPLEVEHAKLLKEYMELRGKNPSSPALEEKRKTLATLDKKRNAMLERVMSGKYALKESFQGMEDSPQVIQQLMAKNAVAGAIERGANFVAFPGAESAQAQLYEKLPNNLKQVVKDLGPGFEYRSVTLQSSNGTPIMHPAIVWGPEGVAKIKKEGIPFKKGGLVDKNTAFIKAHS